MKFRKCFTAILCAIVVLSVSGCGVPSQSVAEAPASTVPDERTNESMSTQTVDSMFSNLPNMDFFKLKQLFFIRSRLLRP